MTFIDPLDSRRAPAEIPELSPLLRELAMVVARVVAAAGLESEAPARALAPVAPIKPVTPSKTTEQHPETYADVPDEVVNQDAEIPPAERYVTVRSPGAEEAA
jgi:hypothetical protein